MHQGTSRRFGHGTRRDPRGIGVVRRRARRGGACVRLRGPRPPPRRLASSLRRADPWLLAGAVDDLAILAAGAAISPSSPQETRPRAAAAAFRAVRLPRLDPDVPLVRTAPLLRPSSAPDGIRDRLGRVLPRQVPRRRIRPEGRARARGPRGRLRPSRRAVRGALRRASGSASSRSSPSSGCVLAALPPSRAPAADVAPSAARLARPDSRSGAHARRTAGLHPSGVSPPSGASRSESARSRPGRARPARPLVPAGLRPNVVFLLMEGVRSEELGAWGGLKGLSPRLDDLARHGIRVARAYSPGTHTPEGELALWYGLFASPRSPDPHRRAEPASRRAARRSSRARAGNPSSGSTTATRRSTGATASTPRAGSA